jgi:nuclear pore complex protein Nup93
MDAFQYFNIFMQSIRDSWLLLKMLLDVELPSKAYEYRLSAKIQKGFVYQSRHFLEQQYLEYVRELVYANLNKAQLGGVPGTRKLIESFLKLRPLAPGLEDGLSDDGQPLWAVVFYCMRCGDLQAAADVLHNIPHLNEIYQYVMAYTSSQDLRLPPNYENKLRLLYKKSVRASTDPYKRAVYCILGRCELNDDHSQVIVKTEDYMWLKLCQVNCESKSDQLPLSKLQFFILKECGESHFDAQRNPHLYFQVLLLTAQFEAAIEFMYRVESLRSHAVHFALALYDQELLHLTSSFNSNLLRDEPNGILRLNIGKLVVNYTRKFCLTDPREAVEYFYRLRHLKDGKDMNLFFSCISELALESREFEMLLGKIDFDGSRKPGYIDKFAPVKSSDVANEIVESVAREAETRGQFEDALRLYDLAQDHGKVLQLSCHLMGGVVSSPSPPQSDRHRLQTLCTSIAERYRNHGYAPKYEISHTFFLLLDLMTFFDRYHSKAFDEALKVIVCSFVCCCCLQ